MTPDEADRHYSHGSDRAWLQMLAVCLKALGYENTEAARARWILERADAVLMLRSVCSEFGDNDWPSDLHLSDVIEKHLWRALEDSRA